MVSNLIRNVFFPFDVDSLVKNISGKKVVFTNGCFDILHPGHICLLSQAKEKGDILVVGMNSDSSVKRIKGDDRPINHQGDRALVLASIRYVDYVAVFEEDTPLELIKKIKPNVLIKGSDWNVENIVGGDFVRSTGGTVLTAPYIEGLSTTKTIDKILKKS